MDEIGLKLCDIQGRLFALFAGTCYDTESLVKMFMTGELASDLDSPYNRMQWAGEEYLLEELLSSCQGTVGEKTDDVSIETLFWMGYVYRYWHYYTGEGSVNIYKQAPFSTMNANYLMFHTLDVEVAIDNLKEIYQQKEKILSTCKK